MKTRRRLFPLAFILVLTILLSGCASSSEIDKSMMECPDLSEEKLKKLGDVEPAYMVEDEHGRYCHVTVNKTFGPKDFEEAEIDFELLAQEGFQKSDVITAINSTAYYLVDSYLDSSLLDSVQTNPEEWLSEHDEYFTEDFVEDCRAAPVVEGGLLSCGISVAGLFPEPLNRTRTPRAINIEINLESVTVVPDKKSQPKPVLAVIFSSRSTYFTTDKKIVDAALLFDSFTGDEGLTSKEDMRLMEKYESLFDGVNNSNLVINTELAVGFYNGDYKRVSGLSWELEILPEAR